MRHIGVSNFDVDQLRRIQQIAPVETLQPPYSLVAREVEDEILPFAEREGIGVIAYSPMGSGLLTGRMTRERIENLPDDDWRKHDERFREPELSRHLAQVERLEAVAERYDTTPGAVAVAWALRNPAVDGAIVGFRRPDQVDPILDRRRPRPHRRGHRADREGRTMSTIGFVGLGTMGGRIAGRLLASGHQVHGTNRTVAKAQPLIDGGLRWQPTPRAVAAAVDVVFSMVSDDAALDAITAGPDGILAGLTPGKVYIDMSTVSPEVSVELAERVRSIGARMLDGPVSGSVPQAETGTLTIMVGGEEAAFRLVQPVLRELGQTVTRVGGNGHGLLLKLAINISLAVQTLAFSEGLLLAERGGIDPRLAARVMSTSAIGSPMLRTRVPLLLDLPERAWFDVELMQKDVRLALQAARGLDVPLPSAATADDMLAKARELGYGGRDIAALHEVLARLDETVPAPAPR